MKNKRGLIGIFLRCVILISLGAAFDPERDYKYLPFMIFIAFVMLIFFLLSISQSNLKRHQKSILFFFTSLVVMLWLGWIGMTLGWQFTLGFMSIVCITWFLINLFCVYLHQRRVVTRWSTAYAAWKSGGNAEEYLKEMEQCEAELKKDTGIMLVYGGIPLNDYISVHKISLLKEMGRNRECLDLLKTILPKIKNPEVQKALSEMEMELSKFSQANDSTDGGDQNVL